MTLITKETISQFIAQNNPRAITQTGYWLDIENTNANKAYIIYTTDQDGVNASTLLIKHPLPFNKNYLYAPYGPVIRKDATPKQTPIILENLLNETKKYIDLSNTIFIRFEPFYQKCHTIYQSLKDIGFISTNNFTQPKDTLILNLLQSEEEILKNMKQKTRYNIRLAHKKNIRIEKTADPNQARYFYELLIKTCDRNSFRPHPLKHYQNVIKILGPKDMAYIYHAYYKNKIIASIIVTFFGKIATYLHGASSNKYRNLMPTYALQWQAIRDAIRHQCRYYDFGGIAPTKAPPSHPWIGITQFKKGFSGIEVSTMGHMEKTINSIWHTLYKTAKYLQK